MNLEANPFSEDFYYGDVNIILSPFQPSGVLVPTHYRGHLPFKRLAMAECRLDLAEV